MIKIYTSYFAAKNKWTYENALSIAGKTPDERIQKYKSLAPTWEIFKQYKETGNQKEYIRSYYRDVLKKLDPQKVAEDCNGKVLLCYEKPSNFCHRQIVAKWLMKTVKDCEVIEL